MTISPPIHYRTLAVNGLDLFYREAGPADAPVLLLLHGFPTSSHMFRHLMPLLADRYRVIAPDLPGFGFTTSPPATEFAYTFDHLAEVVDYFTQALGLARYALYVFDYGAPVGLRLAVAHPERVTALITQNGNAYEEGLSGEWDSARTYWQHPTPENRAALRAMHTAETVHFQYHHGAPDPAQVAPEGPALDLWSLGRPGYDEIQLDLILDYRTNVALYPRFQEYFRTHSPRLWPCGAKTTRISCPPVRWPTAATILPPRSTYCLPGILPLKRTWSKLLALFVLF